MSEDRKEGTKPEIDGVSAPQGAAPEQPPEGNIPPSGSSTKKKLRTIVIAASVLLLGAGALAFFKVPAFHNLLHPHPADNSAKVAQGAAKYTCGMHPFIISDKPGKCPICGMTLTKIEEGGPAAAAGGAVAQGGAAKGGRKLLLYRHPMKPGVTSPVPAKDEMGMDYVPVYEDEVGGGGGAVAGYSTVKVGIESLRLAGVQTAPAVREKISRTVRAVGNVVPDETRVRRVQTKIEGWIEKLHVNFTGQVVAKGQPLLDLYSPELVASQREYLLAIEMHDRMKENPYPEEREMAAQLVQSSRRRLELFDVPQIFIAELERTKNPRRTVTLNAPVSGYVTVKEVFEGTRVMPGMELFTVTDLSRIWIEADLYEYEARAVRVGQHASLAPAYESGLRLKGRVAYIYPTLSPESRTLKVRFEFSNPGLRLKPQMYADVFLELDSATGVVIPDSALIETGLRQIVFVDLGGGSLEPREVKVGVRGDGKAQVLSGVKEGERVAVRANFLLDSESRLKAALTGMTGGGTASPPPQGQPPSQGHAGHGGGR
ncbi:MAG: efflux RND transporter periplasmic adaptor subunit [Deltaproteobacteria bacterium]|nr:efflux RND transporter periplasmic adaptor subunit [Deltaproteobacteria bacterium]